MIKHTNVFNGIRCYGSIDIVVLLLVTLVLLCHYIHGDYGSVTDYLGDIGLRNIGLIVFYYSLSRLLFHFIKNESNAVTLIVLLLISLKEAYESIVQLIQGASYPVGTMLNPNIFACLLSITCSILVAIIFRLKKRVLRVTLCVITSVFLILIFISRSRLALLSIIVSSMCFFSLNPRYNKFIKRHIMSISIVLMVLLAVLYFIKKPSADGRLYMAKIATRIIVHNSIWGMGPESYAGAFGNEQYRYFNNYNESVDISSLDNLDMEETKYACTPMTAFNEFLRIGVEYGPLAMLFALYIIVRAIAILIKGGSSLGYGLLSIFVISQFSYPHCYSIYCLLLSIFIGAAGSLDCCLRNTVYNFVPWIANALEVLFFGLLLFLELPQMELKKRIDDMERDMAFFFKNEEYSTVCDNCSVISDTRLFNLNLLYEYGVSLSMNGEYEKSDSILRLGASRCSNPVFWHEIGHNYVRNGNNDEAEKAYLRSFLMVPNRITPLLYLAQLYHHVGDSVKLGRIASFSDKFKPKIPSYTTKEYHEIIKQLANGR